MRADLRAKCDEIWVINCSPEGHRPPVPTRIFQDVMQPVCIVIASRSPDTDENEPARVRYRALETGSRQAKFVELGKIKLAALDWAECPSKWQAPFLPARGGSWGDFWPLDSIIGYGGPGVTPGRTWVIAPDANSLRLRWERLLAEPSPTKRGDLFENKVADRNLNKGANALSGVHRDCAGASGIHRDPSRGSGPAGPARAADRRQGAVRPCGQAGARSDLAAHVRRAHERGQAGGRAASAEGPPAAR